MGNAIDTLRRRARSAFRVAAKSAQAEDGGQGEDRLSSLPTDVLGCLLSPQLLCNNQDLASVRQTCRALRAASRATRTRLTVLVSDEGLSHLAATPTQSELPDHHGCDSVAAAQGLGPPGRGPGALGRAFPGLQHLTLVPANRFSAVACAAPPLLALLLPARGLSSLALHSWSLHDQEAQLGAVAACGGASLASLELRNPLGIQVQPHAATCIRATMHASSSCVQ